MQIYNRSELRAGNLAECATHSLQALASSKHFFEICILRSAYTILILTTSLRLTKPTTTPVGKFLFSQASTNFYSVLWLGFEALGKSTLLKILLQQSWEMYYHVIITEFINESYIHFQIYYSCAFWMSSTDIICRMHI